jgi:hypothetical protein
MPADLEISALKNLPERMLVASSRHPETADSRRPGLDNHLLGVGLGPSGVDLR